MLWKLLVMLVRVAVIMAPLPPLLTAQPPPPRRAIPRWISSTMKSTGFLATFSADSSRRGGRSPAWPPGPPTNAPDMLIPHMDLSVTDTAYKATVELPGVAQDQVNIEVRDNMLIVEGEKKNETEDKDEKKGYYRMERSYGSFRRVLSLPEDVETDKITATHKDGVLSIEIPRKEPEKPAARKIEVVKGE